MKDRLIQEILDLEWQQFDQVQNIGGRADCQQQPQTFRTMRRSQFRAWNEAMLQSYLGDLQQAQRDGRNLVVEKYAHMMQSTNPSEYAAIAHMLPAIDGQAQACIERIMPIQMRWITESATFYPHLTGNGRVIHASEDSQDQTSYETYLRGELCTYSPETLALYAQHVENLAAQNHNMNTEILEYTVAEYGYASLSAAETRIEKEKVRAKGNLIF